MCRSIKTLFNFDPPATDEEIKAVFDQAVDATTAIAKNLLDLLVTNSQPRNREIEAERAHARAVKRFGT